MKHNKTFLFSLAISPDDTTIASVRELKLLLRRRLGRNYGSVNASAHITLFTFWATMDDYPIILAKIKRILAGMNPFSLKFSGFDFFPPNPSYTFYIKPDKFSGEQIIKYCKQIHDNFDIRFRKKFSWVIRANKNPHMSVGRELFESELFACSNLANDGFENSFHCNSFVVRLLNESRGQYDIIEPIPLLGRDYSEGRQLSLF